MKKPRPHYAFPAKRVFSVNFGKPTYWNCYANYDHVTFTPFNECEKDVWWIAEVHIGADCISVEGRFDCPRETPRAEVIDFFRPALAKILPAEDLAKI